MRVLGLELLAITTGDEETGPGDSTSTPVGFAPSLGDQRWERGVDT